MCGRYLDIKKWEWDEPTPHKILNNNIYLSIYAYFFEASVLNFNDLIMYS